PQGDRTDRIPCVRAGDPRPHAPSLHDALPIVSFAGDAIAYQPIPRADNPHPHEYIYTDIHERVARKLQRLARRAGSDAPLCLIGHSLGTIGARKYLYDLQNPKLLATIVPRLCP